MTHVTASSHRAPYAPGLVRVPADGVYTWEKHDPVASPNAYEAHVLHGRLVFFSTNGIGSDIMHQLNAVEAGVFAAIEQHKAKKVS